MDRRERSNDLGEGILASLDGHQAGVWTALPGFIVDFDPLKMTAHVQPTIMARMQDRFGTFTDVKLPVLPDVPVQFPSGGGVLLTFPVKPGDECLIVFSSRCIDAWHQLGAGDKGAQVQVEERMHDLSDGIAILGVRSLPKVPPNISGNSAQLRTTAGTAYVEVKEAGGIAIKTPGNLDATVGGTLIAKVTGAVEVEGASIKLKGPVTIEGTLKVTDAATFDGTVTGAGEGTFDGIKVSQHQHGGVQNGNSKSGPPVNF